MLLLLPLIVFSTLMNTKHAALFEKNLPDLWHRCRGCQRRRLSSEAVGWGFLCFNRTLQHRKQHFVGMKETAQWIGHFLNPWSGWDFLSCIWGNAQRNKLVLLAWAWKKESWKKRGSYRHGLPHTACSMRAEQGYDCTTNSALLCAQRSHTYQPRATQSRSCSADITTSPHRPYTDLSSVHLSFHKGHEGVPSSSALLQIATPYQSI